jgi:Stage II sporulation protein E (SpoIIE)
MGEHWRGDVYVVRRSRRTVFARWFRDGRLVRWIGGLRVGAFLAAALLVAWGVVSWPMQVPWGGFAPLVVLAGILLSPGELMLTYAGFLMIVGVVGAFVRPAQHDLLGGVVVILGVMGPMIWLSASRSRLGLRGSSGETMLVDLRDRLRATGELPVLPAGWMAESTIQSAYGDSFSGDFIVANRSTDGSRLEVAVVDVSGKGAPAGTRALLLSGGLSGLLGAMEPDAFLGAANAHLLRQRWPEGFATAVHVAIDLDSGAFTVGSAGHPAAAKYSAGSGRWGLLDQAAGPLLGVVESASYPRIDGRLGSGDAILLYTDGVIEARHRDLSLGIDRMLGQAEKLATKGFTGGAAALCASARAGETDDRAVVLIWRR